MVPFAGWEMPVQYEGVIPEHRAVRTDCGVFDVSHMGELEVEGPRAHELLQGLLSNDLDRVSPGGAQYTLLTNEQGGIVDDLIAYRLDEHRYLLVVNASNRRRGLPLAEGTRARGLRRPRRLRRVRAARGAGTDARSSGSSSTTRRVHVGDGRDRRCRVHGQPDRLHRRARCRARGRARRRSRALGRGRRARRRSLRARRARHAPARGLLPAARQRHLARDRRDLGRPRLGLRARQGVHGRGAAPPSQGGGARARSWPRS